MGAGCARHPLATWLVPNGAAEQGRYERIQRPPPHCLDGCHAGRRSRRRLADQLGVRGRVADNDLGGRVGPERSRRHRPGHRPALGRIRHADGHDLVPGLRSRRLDLLDPAGGGASQLGGWRPIYASDTFNRSVANVGVPPTSAVLGPSAVRGPQHLQRGRRQPGSADDDLVRRYCRGWPRRPVRERRRQGQGKVRSGLRFDVDGRESRPDSSPRERQHGEPPVRL